MTFPDPKEFRLVVAGPNESGEADFLEPGDPAEFDFPGVSAGAFYWTVDGGHSEENIGGGGDDECERQVSSLLLLRSQG